MANTTTSNVKILKTWRTGGKGFKDVKYVQATISGTFGGLTNKITPEPFGLSEFYGAHPAYNSGDSDDPMLLLAPSPDGKQLFAQKVFGTVAGVGDVIFSTQKVVVFGRE